MIKTAEVNYVLFDIGEVKTLSRVDVYLAINASLQVYYGLTNADSLCHNGSASVKQHQLNCEVVTRYIKIQTSGADEDLDIQVVQFLSCKYAFFRPRC